MKKVLLTIVILAVCTSGLEAESMVWRVEKGGEVVYIGGTIHLLRHSDYPLPDAFDEAFIKSDVVVLEADVGGMSDPEVQGKLMAGAMYTDGKTLEDVLSEEAYSALAAYCAEAGMPVEALAQFKPAMVMLSLLGLELQKLGISTDYGIDVYYYNRAIDEGKDMIYLETIDEQIDYVLSMGAGQEDEFILHSISDMEELPETMEELIRCWREGDDGRMYEHFIGELKKDFPELYGTLIIERNENWMPEIEALFATEETELVLVGTAHLVGDGGIISTLEHRGYTVEKLE